MEPQRNLELKARDRHPARSLRICRELGAEDKGMLSQRDTYFEVPRGRLKLREEPDAVATLIAYERPDLIGTRESRYRLVEIPEPAALRDVLASTLGITALVSKARHLFLFEGVRIHLDRVDDLGDFIEFEGVAAGGDEPGHFGDLLDSLRGSLGIRDEDLVSESYADLLHAANRLALLRP